MDYVKKEQEKLKTMQVRHEELIMLGNNLELQNKILMRYEKLNAVGAFSEIQYLNQKNIVAETRGRLMQAKACQRRKSAFSRFTSCVQMHPRVLCDNLWAQPIQMRPSSLVLMTALCCPLC